MNSAPHSRQASSSSAGGGFAGTEPAAPAAATRRPPPYEASSQFRHWRFSKEQLAQMRHDANAQAVQRARESMLREAELEGSAPPAEMDFVTPDEEFQYVQVFLGNMSRVCRKFQLNELVRATAIAFMKRFYLYKSIIEYDPLLTMATSIFLACKVENNMLELSKLVAGIKGLDKVRVQELEFTISEVLNFEFWVRHPFEASFGIFLDCQGSIANLDEKLLERTWNAATTYVGQAILTDAVVMYLPSQIAMACWVLASRETGFPFESSFLYHGDKLPGDAAATLRPVMDGAMAAIRGYIEVAPETAKAIGIKAKACRNPAFNPDSKLYGLLQEERERREADEEREEAAARRDRGPPANPSAGLFAAAAAAASGGGDAARPEKRQRVEAK
ncbi:hypothetical protein H9P43_000985 [Blastocladiella emersonii ATCC 22665]|nr:hypothetical protein H9P43_000985 [Blastocladiella emersonii ATCC 22665]